MKNLLCFVFAMFFLMNSAHANDLSKNIFVSDAWVRSTLPSQKNSVAYMTIANNSSKEVILTSASSDLAAATEIHQMSDMNGMMNMRMSSNVHIPALGKMVLRPGGYHIMLINLKKSLNKGDMVLITLHFQDGESIIVKAGVRHE